MSLSYSRSSVFIADHNLVRQNDMPKIEQFLKFFPQKLWLKKMNFYFSIVLDIHKRGKCVYKSHLLILLICYGPYNDTSVETWKDVTFSDLILNISVSCWPELLLLLFEPRLEHWLWHLEVFVYGHWFICTVH